MTHSISIVLALFNGSRFITEQLDSIRTQTLKPDEVIISDDASQDGTYELCRDYIARHSLTGWKVFRNETNLGVLKNFRHALSMCTGDYVFTCDQDDIWMPDKLSAMTQVLDSRPEVSLLVSNYVPVVNGQRIKVRVKNIERDDGTVIQYRLRDTWLESLRPGCTFCFRRELLDKFRVTDIESHIYDSVLWKFAITSDSLFLLNRQLIVYRRHEGNATNQFSRIPPSVDQRIEHTDEDIRLYRTFLDASDGLGIPRENQELLKAKIDFFVRRKKVLETRSVFRMVLFVFRNFRFYPTARNALSDIYAMIYMR